MRNLKRAVSMALASVMLLGMMAVNSGAVFNDADKIVYTEAATITAGLGLFAGTTEGNFDPQGTVTRAQMATVISKMVYGSEVNADSFKGTGKFSDTAEFEGGWAEGYINLCSNLGVVAGYGDGTFRPGNAVTTAEAATMLINVLKIDAGAGQWPLTVMAAAETIKLFEDLASKPGTNETLTRDELAVMVLNALNHSPKGENVYKVGDKKFTDPLAAYLYASSIEGAVVEIMNGEDSLATSTFGLVSATGFVTGNQATGLEYTAVGDKSFDLETDLDMIGHYVTVYYKDEYQSEEEPGTAYAIYDEGKYVIVEKDVEASSKEYKALFGKAVPAAQQVTAFNGIYEMDHETDYDYDHSTWTADKGTYTIFEGKVIGYIAPAISIASKVGKVTTTEGKQSITVPGSITIPGEGEDVVVNLGVLDNSEGNDEVVEYDGIAKGDIVIVQLAQSMVYLTKADAVEGKISKIHQNTDGETVITVAGKEYAAYPGNISASGLSNAAESFDSFNNTFTVYTHDGRYIGWKAVSSEANLTDVVYVLGGYGTESKDDYGNTVVNIYAQGVDMQGKEVSHLIGINYSSALADLGMYEYEVVEGNIVVDFPADFYTFKLSDKKNEKKAGIMVGEALEESYNEEEPSIYSGSVTDADLDSKTSNVRTNGNELAFLSDSTKFIIVEGTLGKKLEIAVMTGSIRRDDVNAPVILNRDSSGNVMLEAMVIGVDNLGILAEDYIFVSEDQRLTGAVVSGGIEYTVYFTATGEARKIVVDRSGTPSAEGFYQYTYDAAEDLYTLELIEAEDYSPYIFAGEVFKSVYKNGLVSTSIPGYDAAGAKIIDTRSEEELKASPIGRIETLADMSEAKDSDYDILFWALIDDDDKVTNIFIVDVDEEGSFDLS